MVAAAHTCAPEVDGATLAAMEKIGTVRKRVRAGRKVRWIIDLQPHLVDEERFLSGNGGQGFATKRDAQTVLNNRGGVR